MRALQKADLPYVCFEAGSEIGGLWRIDNDNGMSHIYASLHTNTSRDRSGFPERPMPDDYPDFPSHRQVLRYLDDFVDHFELRSSVRFRHRVEHVGRRSDGGFAVTVTRPDGSHQLETFEAVIVANGHHWQPHFPRPEGSFSGELIHSSRYKTPLDFVGRRVLVIGIGNSACDIAADLAGLAETVAVSTRRPVHIVPKYVLGRPVDLWVTGATSRLPKGVRHKLFELLLFLARGRQSSYGFPPPPNPPGTEHPTISSEFLNLLGHGAISIRPAVKSVDGRSVHFVDDTSDAFDVIIMATGFDIVFPFFDDDLVRVVDSRIDLYRNVVHPTVERLYFVGLVQPLGAVAPLVAEQAAWIADLINGRCKLPERDTIWSEIEADKERLAAEFVRSRRHSLEVDFFDYLRQIREERDRR